MAALVQGYPQQSGTATMLQARPSSASGMLQTIQAQPGTQYVSSSSQRNSIHGLPATATTPVVYRGGSSPVQPYAFTSTPSLNPTTQWQQARTQRTSSSPAVPTIQSLDYLQPAVARPRYPASVSMTNLPSTANPTLVPSVGHRDDSALPTPGALRNAPSPRSQPSAVPATPTRAPPERYRRSALRNNDPVGSGPGLPQQGMNPTSGMTANNSRTMTEEKPLSQSRVPNSSSFISPNSVGGSSSRPVIDDIGLPRLQTQDEIKRVRRRSMPALDSPGFSLHLTPHRLELPDQLVRPKSANDRDNMALTTAIFSAFDKSGKDSQPGGTLRPGSPANRNSNGNADSSGPTIGPAALPPAHLEQAAPSQEHSRPVNIPPRSSSSEAANTKRIASPSPLSKPVTMDADGEDSQAVDGSGAPPNETTSPRFESPAVKKLAAINEKGGKPKSKTSRLRRAFSFGSAAEFKKAAHDGDAMGNVPGKLQKGRDPEDAYDEEQARIAQQQEAAGIGSSIYAGGRFFHGSTDNLSISSTASSASIMIRKMGRGMKKSTRSLVGLFRPKSIIGAPQTELKEPEVTPTAVSMITAEAERERVNVNPDPKAQAGGGTGFPRLERNSIDASKVPGGEPERVGSSGTDSTAARKSIVGGEKERAEVLAAVRKGILKNRNGSSSPSPRPSDSRGNAFDLPAVPHVTDSPSSSAPSTPNEESHKRAGTVAIGNEDYFVSALRLRQDSKGSPGTPQGTVKRTATFSPRIVFFETWPSQEYDRRGDIATCNRLTPMLAQQIKEELNSFKMEMEVHENSKIYTHFF
ncbi:hypothetical protein VTK26DRAFT_6195 [Humicola hyalothermophila]